ncbi:V-type ATP synthase subunit A [Hujiaoplasma nucleasis]|uniref:V-type ATP synthase alpha chain n=1 Tax=Hujiaoplasma nucleasis TaxID=2725268 RepID=A0A7L6N4Z4_9MOLU|nr:V-type ATP synthase subunit A [Hujiaoplasma nucleasis]QLY40562.1 V-type ATP synthase subunit A [Hujiaoplasma nucleasis]
MNNKVYSINGPVVKVKNASNFQIMEMVFVGKDRLLGEVISISDDFTVIQVYESTVGLKPGEEIIATGESISVTLGPGLLTNIFDGIQRPLKQIYDREGQFIKAGTDVDILDFNKSWDVHFTVKVGDQVEFGQIFGEIQETSLIKHRLLVPKGKDGVVKSIKEDGSYKLKDVLMVVEDKYGNTHELNMIQRWPIKKPRPTKERLPLSIPLVSGQRVIDTMFPIAKGGTAGVPGGFGTGKTMMQHQFAKWCDADIIVYIGCGERGNEMTQTLEEFSELIDPKSNKPLIERTVLIANTSNMPVAAREASIYTGVAIAEYYRDMGYHVAVMADSTSRWAEALREISGRLEEMPAEEGFPAYLPSRIAQFYERAGYMNTMSDLRGSVSIIGAISPQGSDFSEPVTQNTKRFVRCFWALDKELAYARHYAAINWNLSYSEYINDLSKWYNKQVGVEFLESRQKFIQILAEENKLMEIVKLIGKDVLPDNQKLILEIARVIRVGYLQQNAFHKDDTFVPLEKQLMMMNLILYLQKEATRIIKQGKAFSLLVKSNVFEKVIKIKYEVPNDQLVLFDNYYKMIDEALHAIK